VLAEIVTAIKDIVDMEGIYPVAEKLLMSDFTPFTNRTSI
jgi:hypothetical protein